MKFFTFSFLFVLLFSASNILQAQEFNMPPDITKFGADDCSKYKNDILKCISWMLQTPLSKDIDKRHVSDAFLLMWISHCPDVSINIKPYVDKFEDVSPEFIAMFMGAWAKHEMETKDKNELNCNLAAVKSLVEHYTADTEMPRSEYMDKLVAADKKGKLKDWVLKALKEK